MGSKPQLQCTSSYSSMHSKNCCIIIVVAYTGQDDAVTALLTVYAVLP
jgi:hypothetical protein